MYYICSKLFGAEGAKELSSKVVDRLQSVIPKNYPWPGNFRELEQAVRNIIVHDEFVPLGQGSEKEFDINQVYANTQVSLNWLEPDICKKGLRECRQLQRGRTTLGRGSEDS